MWILICEYFLRAVAVLKDWQALISGMLVLIGAWWIVHTMSKHNVNRQKEEKEHMKARHDAARMALPFSLDVLNNHATVIMTILYDVMSKFSKSSEISIYSSRANYKGDFSIWPATDEDDEYNDCEVPRHLFEGEFFPNIPLEAIAKLQLLVETSVSSDVVPTITRLVAQIQVGHARLEELTNQRYSFYGERHVTCIHNIESYIIDWAKIRAFVNCLYGYGRFEKEKPEMVNWDNIKEQLTAGSFSKAVSNPENPIFLSLYKKIESYRDDRPVRQFMY